MSDVRERVRKLMERAGHGSAAEFGRPRKLPALPGPR